MLLLCSFLPFLLYHAAEAMQVFWVCVVALLLPTAHLCQQQVLRSQLQNRQQDLCLEKCDTKLHENNGALCY